MRRPSGRVDAAGRGRARHIPALDGLRGAAVAAVLLFHAGHLAGGWLGVDLFFVLSGFLITSLLLAERAKRDRISLSAFWARRGRRLLPALFLVLIGVGVYAVVWAAPRELAQIRSDGLATLGYVANWHQIGQGQSYWNLFRAPSPLEHTWSLAIEEQFYLVWPIVVVALLAFRREPRRVLAAAVIGITASFAAMLVLYHPGANPQRVYLGTDTRASSILIGAALAALVATRGWTPVRGARAALEGVGVASLGFLAWAWLRLSGTTPAVYQGLLLACSLAAGLVIAAAAHPRPGLVARIFSFRPLRALGVISYGVYLWHWPVYLVADSSRVGLTGWPLTAVQVSITLAVAVASYYLVEAPIRHGALKGWRIRVLAPAAMAATAAIVVVATIPPPVPHTDPVAALRHLTAAAQPGPTTTAGATTTSSVPSLPFKVMVTGDSVAFRLMPAFQSLSGPLGFTATDRTAVGCALEHGATAHRLPDGTIAPAGVDCSTAWASQAAQDRPDVAFVSLAGQFAGDWQINGQWLHPCDAAYDQWFERQVVVALSTLTGAGTRVALALPAPGFGGVFAARDECMHTDELRAANQISAHTVDFKTLVCPQNRCIGVIDGITLREDGMHYVGPAAELVVRWLVPQLREIASTPPPP